jgi:hypothetical protein
LWWCARKIRIFEGRISGAGVTDKKQAAATHPFAEARKDGPPGLVGGTKEGIPQGLKRVLKKSAQ